jgi:hypothetical protein
VGGLTSAMATTDHNVVGEVNLGGEGADSGDG